MISNEHKGNLTKAWTTPISPQAHEIFVGIVLALWVFGQITFAYSSLASANWVMETNPLLFIKAIVIGCLIAALACKGLDFELPGIVGLFCLLFVGFTVWNRTGDDRLIVLALFVVAAKGAGLSRLLRYYAVASSAAILATIVLTHVFIAAGDTFAVAGHLPEWYGFDQPSMIACILFSILCATTLNTTHGSRVRMIVVAACIVCAALAFFPLHAKRSALLMIALGACIVVDERAHEQLRSLFSKRAMVWLIAALPIALFCVVNDIPKFSGVALGPSAFMNAVPFYGFAAVVCFAALYVRTVILLNDDDQRFVVYLIFVLYSLYMSFEQFPLYMEFNCSLFLLSIGLERSILCGGASEANHA